MVSETYDQYDVISDDFSMAVTPVVKAGRPQPMQAFWSLEK